MSNLSTIRDWINDHNHRPASIGFVTDKAELEKKKRAMQIGETYTDEDGRVWEKKMYGWAKVPKVLTALKESNPHCAACGKEIDYTHRHNVTAYSKTKTCFDCLIEIDTERKINGTFKDHANSFILRKQQSYILDMLDKLREGYKPLDSDELTFTNEFGDIERWSGGNIGELKEDILKDIAEGERVLSEINEALEELK
jgi:hypothetical protein